MEDDNPFLKRLAIEGDPGKLRTEFSIQLQIWEMSGHKRLSAEQTLAVLRDFVDIGWKLDDVFLAEVYRDPFCSPFDRQIVRDWQQEHEAEELAME